MRRATKPSDPQHPFGYGMELYFWTLLVALLMFAIAGCVTVLEGVSRILQPHELTDLAWNYSVLGVSFVFNGITAWLAFKEFRQAKGDVSYWEGLKRIKDPSAITVLFEDSASLAGLLFAFLGIFLGTLLDWPELDGIASVLIGVLMGGVAVGLVYQSKVLLIGESVNREVVESIRTVVTHDEAIQEIKDLLTMHLAPQDILLNLRVRFRDDIDSRQLGEAVERLKRRLCDKHPDLKRIFIEPCRVDDKRQPS